MGNFAGHNLHLETPRLSLRPFDEPDFDLAVPFYREPEFLNAMELDPPDEPVTSEYLKGAGKAMAEQGFLFAIVEKASGRAIGEACLQWMNLDRGRIAGEKVMRLPIGIWDKALWGRGYGKEVVRCLMAYAFWRTGNRPLLPDGRGSGQRTFCCIVAVPRPDRRQESGWREGAGFRDYPRGL